METKLGNVEVFVATKPFVSTTPKIFKFNGRVADDYHNSQSFSL